MNLTNLQRDAHAIAKDHGWWDEERTFGDLIALVHSELSEALKAYRTWDHNSAGMPAACDLEPCPHPPVTLDEESNPVGVASELADVVIRVADMAEHYNVTLEFDWPVQLFHPLLDSHFGENINVLHDALSDVSSAYRADKMEPYAEDYPAWIGCIGGFTSMVYDLAAHYGIDLDAAIEAKMEYNRTRSYRHGGKAL